MAQKKDDRRTAYSKKVIREALFELMKEKPLNKISITEICSLADVNRSTFYSYYEDIYDLHRKILREYFEKQHETLAFIQEYIGSVPSPTALTKKDFYTICLCFFTTASENRSLYKFIYSQNSSNSIHVNTGQVLYRMLSPMFYGENTPMKQKVVFKKAYTFTTGGLTAMLIDWLKRDCIEAPEEMARHAASYCFGAILSEIGEYNFEKKEN